MYVSGQVKTRLAGVHDGRHDPHIWSFLTADQFHKLQRKCYEGYCDIVPSVSKALAMFKMFCHTYCIFNEIFSLLHRPKT